MKKQILVLESTAVMQSFTSDKDKGYRSELVYHTDSYIV